MWLSVFIVFSAVVFVWASSFQQKLVFMLDGSEDKALVGSRSPFAAIGAGVGDLKATVLDLFGLVEGTREQDSVIKNMQERVEQRIKPRLLPVSD